MEECDAYMTAKPEKCNACKYLKMGKDNLHYCEIEGKGEMIPKLKVKIGNNELELAGGTKRIRKKCLKDFLEDISIPRSEKGRLTLSISHLKFCKKLLMPNSDFIAYCELIDDIIFKLNEELELINEGG